MIQTPAKPRRDQGFTLTELMVVVVILALLAAIAVPVLNRDTEEESYKKLVSTFMRDLQRQRFTAISTKEDRLLEIGGIDRQLMTLVGSTRHPMEKRRAPIPCYIAGVTMGSPNGMPGNAYVKPANKAMTVIRTIRFNGTGGAQVEVGGVWQDLPATIFFSCESGHNQGRIVVFPATAYAALYQDW